MTAGGDLITYNYPAIHDCVDKMAKFVSNVEQQAGDLENQTKQLMAGQWDGDSGTQYDHNASRMQQRLEGLRTAVTGLHGKVSDGAQELQEADRAGASGQTAN